MQTIESYYKDAEFKTIDEIGIRPWDYYLMRAIEVTSLKDKPVVLKTDAFNEAEGYPDSNGIALNLSGCKRVDLLEYDIATLSKARYVFHKEKEVTFTRGDIRELPFKDDAYDVLLDLSTIDHVPAGDVPKVLDEYRRVLKPEGLMLLIAWCEDEKMDQPTEWKSTNQYYFNEQELAELVTKRFIVHHAHVFHRNDNGEYMVCMVCQK